MALLSVSGISKMEGDHCVVKDIYFSQEPFEKIAIAGETGSGKTSLLNIIGLLDPDWKGDPAHGLGYYLFKSIWLECSGSRQLLA